MFTIFYQKGILIFCFLHIDHNIKLYPWTIAEGLSKKMKNYECPGQGPLCSLPYMAGSLPYRYGQQSPLNGRQSPLNGRQSVLYGRQSSLYGRQSPLYGRQSPLYGRQSSLYGRQTAIWPAISTI